MAGELQYRASDGALLYHSADGTLMAECCCGGVCCCTLEQGAPFTQPAAVLGIAGGCHQVCLAASDDIPWGFFTLLGETCELGCEWRWYDIDNPANVLEPPEWTPECFTWAWENDEWVKVDADAIAWDTFVTINHDGAGTLTIEVAIQVFVHVWNESPSNAWTWCFAWDSLFRDTFDDSELVCDAETGVVSGGPFELPFVETLNQECCLVGDGDPDDWWVSSGCQGCVASVTFGG